jgi:hypothetical protein
MKVSTGTTVVHDAPINCCSRQEQPDGSYLYFAHLEEDDGKRFTVRMSLDELNHIASMRPKG